MSKDPDVLLQAYVRHLIEEWLAADKKRTASELARKMGVTQVYVSTIRSGKRGVGLQALTGLAEVLGTSIEQIRKDALRWAQGEQPSETRVEYADRYPNRQVATLFAERAGLVPEAIDAVRSMELKADNDLSPLEWFDIIRLEDTRWRMTLYDKQVRDAKIKTYTDLLDDPGLTPEGRARLEELRRIAVEDTPEMPKKKPK